MQTVVREALSLLNQAVADWIEDKASQMGAALAFYSALSLAPLMVLALGLAALVFDRDTATTQMRSQMTALVGTEGAQAINAMIENAQQLQLGTVASLLALVTLLVGASGVFGQLQDAMNVIWDVPAKPRSGWWELLRSRFLSFAMVLGTGFLLLVSLILSTVISGIGGWLETRWPGLEPLTQAANAAATFLMVTLLFAMIFKLLPDTRVAWRDVWAGAMLTAALFTLGKALIGLYLGRSAIGSAYGAAGSLVVLLVWIYYSAQILFFGAELTQAYARRVGSHRGRATVRPASAAKNSASSQA